MKIRDTLTDPRTPAWPLVSSWIDTAVNRVEVLPPDPDHRGAVLRTLGITPASSMGAVVAETGGLLVDHGWIRILGGAGRRMRGDLSTWNGFGPAPVSPAIHGLLVVAHDAAGGVFAIDRGALGAGRNDVWYLGPDDLRWVAVHRGYSYFLEWTCTGDVAGFAGRLRWEGWKEDVASAGVDRAFVASPARWTAEGRHTTRANLRAISMASLFAHELETGRRLQAAQGQPMAASRRSDEVAPPRSRFTGR